MAGKGRLLVGLLVGLQLRVQLLRLQLDLKLLRLHLLRLQLLRLQLQHLLGLLMLRKERRDERAFPRHCRAVTRTLALRLRQQLLRLQLL